MKDELRSIVPVGSKSDIDQQYQKMVEQVGLTNWIDSTEKEFAEKAQEIINILCEDDEIPKIPVKFKKRVGSAFGAVFRPREYEIWITKHADADTLVHEFHHYVIHLFGSIAELDEEMVMRATRGYLQELIETKHNVPSLEEFNTISLEFEKLDKMQQEKEQKELEQQNVVEKN